LEKSEGQLSGRKVDFILMAGVIDVFNGRKDYFWFGKLGSVEQQSTRLVVSLAKTGF
jgi:hypothetical protein